MSCGGALPCCETKLTWPEFHRCSMLPAILDGR
eukprot:UN09022